MSEGDRVAIHLLGIKHSSGCPRRLANEVAYQQPFQPDGSRLCINCAAAVPGGEAWAPEAVLPGMALLFCG